MQIFVFGCDQLADSSDAFLGIKFALTRVIDSMWSRIKKLA
tara:strand:+ start:255 stop:377 length:123 start_codon:yes stop_codon:yes gene_type:complete